MPKNRSKFEFLTLLSFLTILTLLVSNAFVGRIAAQSTEVDVYQKLEPIGIVLDMIQKEYVRDADIDQLVEGALSGMMGSLDKHSSFITREDLNMMREETRGEFEGIGVSIKLDEDENLIVFQPIPGSPADEAGLQPFDRIVQIDGVNTTGMSLREAAERIRGPRGEPVTLTVLRPLEDEEAALSEEPEVLEFVVKRDKVPLESIKEARIFPGGIGYIRISDFKDNTADDIRDKLDDFLDEGMRAFVLDLRWNPGGLLTASQEVTELFLPPNQLVTYTKGRGQNERSDLSDANLLLRTEGTPALPLDFPVVVLVNEATASSSEIVVGALQYYKRAIIVGENTFGKGSVQTIIPLQRPADTALRLTTALYYTPAEVTIDGNGIKPDVEVPLSWEDERALGRQLYESYEDDPGQVNEQNHGLFPRATEAADAKDEVAVDVQLERAIDLLREDTTWEALVDKYHKPIDETQVALKDADAEGSAAGNLAEQ